MLEAEIDLWHAYERGSWVCITTNGVVKRDGMAVMGAGVAKEAAERFPELPRFLGSYIKKYGNRVFWYPDIRLITFPTKHHYKDSAEMALINTSARQLVELVNKRNILTPVYLPRPGCGLGQLEWGWVRKNIADILDDRFIIVWRP